MRVYHGSTQSVKKPVIGRGRLSTDFGKGFYTTTNMEQAKRWAISKQKNAGNTANAIVTIYEVDNDLLENTGYNILKFDAPNESWLNFVVTCRKGIPHNHHIVCGPVANDKIYVTLTLYESDALNLKETLTRLEINEYYNQISFHDDKVVKELRFIESIDVTEK